MGENLASTLTVKFALPAPLNTATRGVDYPLIPLQVTFPPNQTTATVTIAPIADNVAENTETMHLELTPLPTYTIGLANAGSATNGADYHAISGSVAIPANILTATVTVTPLVDALAESPETVTLTLLVNSAYNVGAQFTAAIFITP